jgi:hypothetical protein
VHCGCSVTKYGGELATYDDAEQQSAVVNGLSTMFAMFNDKGMPDDVRRCLWLGYHKLRNSQTWVNIRGITEDKWLYRYWYTGEPSAGTSPGAERCALQDIFTPKGGRDFETQNWLADSCDFQAMKECSAHGVVCRLEPIGESSMSTQQA